jgi:hypothetical protein
MDFKTDLQLIQDSVNQYVVRPANALGISGFVFDIEGEAEIQLDSDITDHYVEDNSSRHDHISLKPEKIVLKNYVGELKNIVEDETIKGVVNVATKLVTIANYAPAVADGVSNLKTALKGQTDFNQSIDNVADLWSAVKNMNPFASAQQQAYVYFKSLWKQKILVSVQTPYEFITQCAFLSVRAHQAEDSKYITDFTVTLKKINKTSTLLVPFDKNKYQNRAAQQNAPEVNKGKASTNTVAYDIYKLGVKP